MLVEVGNKSPIIYFEVTGAVAVSLGATLPGS